MQKPRCRFQKFLYSERHEVKVPLFNKLRDVFFLRSGFVRSCFRDSGRMSTDSANANGLICSSEFLDV